jgi:phage host-nuclease inhibitor protein Gam
MAVSRRKAPKQEAPQTIEEAVALLTEYRDTADKLDELKADAASSIAKIEAVRDEFAAPLDQRLKDVFRQLRAWWGVAAPSMTEGKRKSITLAGCTIGERKTPPSLKHEGLKVGDLVEELATLGMDELVKLTVSLDKQACIKAISAGDQLGQLLLWIGARNHQAEEFFIDRPDRKDAPEQVSVEEIAA